MSFHPSLTTPLSKAKKMMLGTSRISFESFLGVSSLARKLPILDAQGFIDFRNDYQRWDPIFLTSDPS